MTFGATLGTFGGVTLGVTAGLLFAWLWLWVVPWSTHRDFFVAMSGLTRRILKLDDAKEFWKVYADLLGKTVRYVGRNLAGTLVASVPVVGMYYLTDITEASFLVPFIVAMMVVFCWPRLWPAAKAY